MMPGYPISKGMPDFSAVEFDGLFGASSGVIDATRIFGDTPLKGIRVLSDIMEQARGGGCCADIEPSTKSASKRSRTPKVPLQALPRVKRFAWSAVGVKHAIAAVGH
jgi:hypothetical protein